MGLSDLPSVTVTIWAIYFLVLGVKRDSKFFYLAFPFFMIAFLTRYNNALLIFPIIIYLVINRDQISYKNVIGGILASILTVVPVLIFFYEQFGNIIYPFINFASTSSIATVTVKNSYYNPNVLFFLQNIPSFVGIIGVTLLILSFIALMVWIFTNLTLKENQNKHPVYKFFTEGY